MKFRLLSILIAMGLLVPATLQAARTAQNSYKEEELHIDAQILTKVEQVHLVGAVDKQAIEFVKKFLTDFGANDPESLKRIADSAAVQISLHARHGGTTNRLYQGSDYKTVALTEMAAATDLEKFYGFMSVTMRAKPDGKGFQVRARRVDMKEKLITPFILEVAEIEGKGLMVTSIVMHDQAKLQTPIPADSPTSTLDSAPTNE